MRCLCRVLAYFCLHICAVPGLARTVPTISPVWMGGGHPGTVLSVAITPDGSQVVSGGTDCTVRIRDLTDGTLLPAFMNHGDYVQSVAVSPDGNTIVSGGTDSHVRIWRMSDGKQIGLLMGHTGSVNGVAITPDGTKIVSADGDQSIKIWSLANRTLLRTIDDPGWADCVAVSPDGHTLVTAGYASPSSDVNTDNIKVWNTDTGELVRSLGGSTGHVNSVAISPDGNLIVAAYFDWTVKIWDFSSGALLRTLTGHARSVEGVAISPDGTKIVSGDDFDGIINVWNTSDGTLLRTIDTNGSADCVAFSPDGNTIVSGGGAIHVWSVADGSLLRTVCPPEAPSRVAPSRVAVDGDGNTIVSSYLTSIRVWNPLAGTPTITLDGHTGYVTGLEITPDGNTIVSGSHDKTVKVWDLTDGTLVRTLVGHSGSVYDVAISPTGGVIVSGGNDNRVNVWDLKDGTLIGTFDHGQSVNSVAFGSDGTTIVSGGGNEIRIWDAANSELIRTIDAGVQAVYSVAIDADLTTIVSGDYDDEIKLWNLADGTLLRTLTGHTSWVLEVVISPDGNTIVSCSRDNRIKVWNVADGFLLRTLYGHNHWVYGLAVSSDGRAIISKSEDGRIVRWVADPPLLNSVPTWSIRPDTTASEQERLTFIISASDPDGDTLSYGAPVLPRGASFDTNSQTFDWTPGYDQAGDTVAVFSVSDWDETISDTVGISVTNTNRLPTWSLRPDTSTSESELLTFVVSASDPDGDALSYGSPVLPSGAAFDTTTQAFSWTPDYSQAGDTVAVFSVSDGKATVVDTVGITVLNSNRTPTWATRSDTSTSEATFLAFVVSASDPDGDALSYRAPALPHGAEFDTTTHAFSWTPDYDQAGDTVAVFSVSDGEATILDSVGISVEGTNRQPVWATRSDTSTSEATFLAFVVSASDPDGDALSYRAPALPHGAEFDTTTHAFSWTPDYDQAGDTVAVFSVSDGEATILDSVGIRVLNSNRTPQLLDGMLQSARERQPYEGILRYIDLDGDSAWVVGAQVPPWVSFECVSDTSAVVSGVPQEADTTSEGLMVVYLSDGEDSVEVSVTLVVEDVNYPPTFISEQSGTDTVLTGTAWTDTLSFVDPDGGDRPHLVIVDSSSISGMEIVSDSVVVHSGFHGGDAGAHAIRVCVIDDSSAADTLTISLWIEIDLTTIAEARPLKTELRRVFPNPFNPSTTIRFALADDGIVRLRLYNVIGQRIRELMNGRHVAGYHEVTWDGRDDMGRNVASGIYVVQLVAIDVVEVRRVTLVR